MAGAAAAALALVLAPQLAAPALSDEVFTLDSAALPWPALWKHLQADVHPPLYYLAAKLWLGPFGPSLAAIRVFSLLMALAAVLFSALLPPSAAAGRGWAAWFFAANGIVLAMAATGRMYAMLALWCVLAWLASDRLLRGGGRGRLWLAGCAIAAGLCTHHFFALFLGALALWIAVVHGRQAMRVAPAWSAAVAFWALVWGRTAWRQLTERPQHLAWVPPVQFSAWAETAGAHLLFYLIALPAGLAALAFMRRRGTAAWPVEARAAALAAVFALALPGLISVWKPVLKSRFTIIAAPFMAAALAPLGGATAGVLPVTALAAGAAWSWWPGPQAACNSAEAARKLAAMTAATDTVVFCRLTRKPVEYHWPSPRPWRRSFPAEIDAHPGYEGRQSAGSLLDEAGLLVSSTRGRVFVLADASHPAFEILAGALEEAGFRAQPPLLACPSAGPHYFNRLVVFDPPVRPAESPSAGPLAQGSPPPGRAVAANGPQ